MIFCALFAGCATTRHKHWNEPSPVRQADSMQELVRAIRKILPDGWVLEHTPFSNESSAINAKHGHVMQYQPYIAVYRKKPIGGYFNSISMILPREPFVLVQQYKLSPYWSPEEHRRSQNENQRKTACREFYKRKLQHLWDPTLKPSSFDPENYRPNTPEELRLRIEYEFAYAVTEPRDIPDYYYGALSVFPRTHRHFVFYKKDEEREYREVERNILMLFKKYEGF